MHTETITWRPVAQGLPDTDVTVLVQCTPDHTEPVWLGYLDGDEWRSVEGDRIAVSAWADVPKGPQ